MQNEWYVNQKHFAIAFLSIARHLWVSYVLTHSQAYTYLVATTILPT